MKTGGLVAAALAAGLLAACGGGGGGSGGTPAPAERTAHVFAETLDSGWGDERGFSGPSNIGTRAGDNAFDLMVLGVFRFDVSQLPFGAQVVSAFLVCEQMAVVGLPYDHFGDVWVDHMDIGFGLNSFSFRIAALEESFAVLSTDAVLEKKQVDVTAQLRADLAAFRTTSDYRIHYDGPLDFNRTADYAEFSGGLYGTRPPFSPATLVIRFIP